MKAFGYIRVSSGRQAKKYSLSAQRQEIEQYCSAHGIEMEAFFMDHISGSKLIEREALMEMLDRAGREVDMVVATESDRISRDTFQFGWVSTHLSMRGVRLQIINERTAETPMEKAFQKIRAVFSEFETDLRQWRINRGRAKAKAAHRFMNRPPLGYAICNGAIAVDEKSKDQVERIFKRYAAGESMESISRALNKNRRTIAYILKNPFYVDSCLHGKHAVFISKTLFQKVQDRIGQCAKTSPRASLVSQNGSNDQNGKARAIINANAAQPMWRV